MSSGIDIKNYHIFSLLVFMFVVKRLGCFLYMFIFRPQPNTSLRELNARLPESLLWGS